MTEYQTLTIKGTHEELTVSTMEYPLMLAGIFYIKFIEYYHNTMDDTYEPVEFVTFQPQDILKRENIWTQEEEDIIKAAAQEAKNREATMDEYREAAEEEMKRRATEIPSTPKVILPKKDDDDIDPDFATAIDPMDPNYM